jgi:hypothetical protein
MPSRSVQAAAFQTIAELDQIDLEVARLTLNPTDRKFQANARDHLAKLKALSVPLELPGLAWLALEDRHNELVREVLRPQGGQAMVSAIANHRAATQAVREFCFVALRAPTEPTGCITSAASAAS